MIISALTYNIHKGFTRNNRQFVLHRMRDMLRELDVDIVLLQEVTGEHRQHADSIHNWPDASQFEFLADQVWPHYAYGKNAIAVGRHHGNAILSKYPFCGWDNINISPFKSASRSLLHGNITLPGVNRKIHVISLHLGLLGIERRSQIKKLNRHLESLISRQDAVIIGGDFNDWSSRQVSRHLNPDLGLKEIFMSTNKRFARTFPSRWPVLCVDRIYFRGLQSVSCACLNDRQWRELSDHVPLVARFSIEDD